MKLSLASVTFSLFFLSLFAGPVQAQSGEARPVQVVVKPVQFERQSSRVDAVGTAEATKAVVLYPAVTDKVTAVHFEPGDWVKAGDTLLELDARRQRVALNRAEILLADAERTVKRLKESRKEGAIAQSQLDDAITLRDIAKVELSEAEVELEDRQIVAPFDGVMGLTDIEVGDRINQQTAIASIDSRKELYVHFQAPEDALNMLQADSALTLRPWNNPSQTIPAALSQVDSRIDPQSRTVRVRAIIDNGEDKYRPGMSFRVNLELKGDRYAVVPEAALLWGETGAYIWVAENDKAKRVDVQIKQRFKGYILVAADLSSEDLLIVEGVQSLRENQPVFYSTEV
ncbi:efflux RND transporter periplasmic adaptor subunit [Lacimicrobium alkaliphilum]|uniref:Hemolysin D n=1 Tax=Lacimicrobium alkaliphilum TaxID=1526571 RepID=A0ABQ1R3Z1_9ALTE|nr:efflux RND transporter periplasmic adaptor subunit [Lacimicrobium alkaliphilum]GGD55580.1 hemolysin D [Lacimicrobium alkaliphilum]